MPKPKLAVFKFASCDGCQLSLLDAEDELLAVAEAVEIAYFLEARTREIAGPYDIGLVEGSITTAARRRADPPDPQAMQRPGLHRRLRHRRRHPGAAELGRRGRLHLPGLRVAGIHQHARHEHAHLRARDGRLRAPRLPDQPAPAPRGLDVAAPGLAPRVPRYSVCIECKRQADRLHRGRPGSGVPRAGHAGRLRRALSRVQPRVLRLLRAQGAAEPGQPHRRLRPRRPATPGISSA